ncbi:MAG: nucleotide exchange factor GrpE [Patescibacteria group bacterium]
MTEVKIGRYRHYKGNEYQVLNLAQDSEDQSRLVVYQDLKDESKIWVRPQAEFLEQVEIEGELKDRFEFLGEDDVKDSWENKYKRALADYHNLTKQTAKEKQEFVKYALDNFLQDILPVYDHLKMSLAGSNVKESENPWLEGVRHVAKQFKEVLAAYGVEEIKTVGEKFDHSQMEAMEGAGDLVKQELSSGYTLHGKVIRPAKVVVE